MKRSTGRVLLVITATVVMIVINAIHPLFSPTGKGTGEISDQFHNFFTPAGYVFSIWGLIYTALIAFTVYQALPSQRDNEQIARIDRLYVLSCLFNASWMVVWQREWFPATLVLMLAILGTLVALYLRLDPTRYKVTTAESWFIHWPFSVYLGWITVATVANVTILLQHLGWKGGGIPEPVWGAIMVSVALVIFLLVTFPRKDRAYLLVLAWAAIGIAVKYKATFVMLLTGSAVAGVALLMVGYYFFHASKTNSTSP